MQNYRSFTVLVLCLVALIPLGIRTVPWLVSSKTTIDPVAVQIGKGLFLHEWTPGDPLAIGGDGLGPVFNANSCVACHRQGGAGGGGPLENNVTAFTVRPIDSSTESEQEVRQGVVHAHATESGFQETLGDIHPLLPAIAQPKLSDLLVEPMCLSRPMFFPSGIDISQRNTPALFGARLIDEIPDRVIIANERRQRLKWGMADSELEHVPVGRALRLADGRIGKFGWKAQTASLADFVQAACANELGLGNPGNAQPASIANASYIPPGLDLTLDQCRQITAFVASLGRPIEQIPTQSLRAEQAKKGKQIFTEIGCADCHTPDLGCVAGIYGDLLLHRMGRLLQGGGSYGEPPLPLPEFVDGGAPVPSEWRTPPLWGVADSAPYLHDGRAATLRQAIILHGGQGASAAERFQHLRFDEQGLLIVFLQTLKAPITGTELVQNE